MSIKGTTALALALAIGAVGCNRASTPVASAAAPSAASAAPGLAAPASAAPVADSADAADVKAFLDGLYAHYKTSKDNDFNIYDAKAGVFDPDTIKLLKDDTRALKGDVGVLDGDDLCDCQDFVSLKTTVTVQSATPTTATATAAFVDTGMSDQGVRSAAFQLVKTPAGWRIHDIKDANDTAWLRQQLLDEIKRLAKGGDGTSTD
jgi:hypothetical protein